MINNEYDIPFEFLVVHGSEAIKTCLELSEEKGITPVIMGGPRDIEVLFRSKSEETPKEIIERSKNFNIKEFVKKEDKGLEDDLELLGEFEGWEDDLVDEIKEFMEQEEEWLEDYPELFGEFEEGEDVPCEQKEGITAHLNILSKQPLEQVYVGLIPTEASFEIPAYVSFGDWNWCPKPEEHVGIMRYWNEKYGIEIASITSGVIECIVKNPPSTKEEALELAKEQYCYCPDIVEQGTQTIAALVATLLNNKYWYFWWD